MQRIASCSGFAYFDDQISYLTIHPIYGPWHSFRAVVVVMNKDDDDTIMKTTEPSKLALPCLMTKQQQAEAKLAFDKAVKLTESNHDKKEDCNGNKGRSNMMSFSNSVAASWIELRDCVASRDNDQYRFDNTQLWYHYTKDIKYLEEAMSILPD